MGKIVDWIYLTRMISWTKVNIMLNYLGKDMLNSLPVNPI